HCFDMGAHDALNKIGFLARELPHDYEPDLLLAECPTEQMLVQEGISLGDRDGGKNRDGDRHVDFCRFQSPWMVCIGHVGEPDILIRIETKRLYIYGCLLVIDGAGGGSD